MRLTNILVLVLLLSLSGCSGCSKSGRRETNQITGKPAREKANKVVVDNKRMRTTIVMEKYNGLYQVPVEINRVAMHFIFETGASSISISNTEANFLYKQGKLTE
jgi:aspartyl protease family protein